MPSSGVKTIKTVSVTVEPLLLQQAHDAGLNLSPNFTEGLQQETCSADSWKQQNNAGLKELNRISEQQGLLSDEYRAF